MVQYAHTVDQIEFTWDLVHVVNAEVVEGDSVCAGALAAFCRDCDRSLHSNQSPPPPLPGFRCTRYSVPTPVPQPASKIRGALFVSGLRPYKSYRLKATASASCSQEALHLAEALGAERIGIVQASYRRTYSGAVSVDRVCDRLTKHRTKDQTAEYWTNRRSGLCIRTSRIVRFKAYSMYRQGLITIG